MAATAHRNALRLCVCLVGAVPVVGGAWGAIESLGGVSAWSVDHYRYLSGLLLAVGLGFWSTVPNIERRTQRFRQLTGLVAIGGLCRLLGVALGDPVTVPVVVTLVLELAVTPLLCAWQGQISMTK